MFTILGADGNEYGPVTPGKIHEWIAGGRANLETKARRSGETEWQILGDFPEFRQFGTTGNSTPPALPSSAADPVAVPVPALAIPTASLELEPADRLVRLGAVIVDSLIGGLFMMPAFGVLMAAGFFTEPDHPNVPLLIAGGGLFFLSVLVLLGIQVYLLTTRGQTMGKKLLSIKIVNYDDEANPGFVKVFLLRVIVNGLVGAVPVLGPVYSLVDICFIFREDRRCLHDLIANTKVVKA